jgi:hypothetical protein
MLAGELAKKMGKDLIGRIVLTEQIGDWQGGAAEVIEIGPDPAAPEIVFNVRSTQRKNDIIGVFNHELILLLPMEDPNAPSKS